MLVNAFGDNFTVRPDNVVKKFREAFEEFTPGVNWTMNKASGDIVQVDGNAIGASYLVISKDPWAIDTETSITSTETFNLPVEVSVGLHMSQRVYCQEFSVDFISTETPLPSIADIAIASISQTTTTLTVVTATPHNLYPGRIIGIRGVLDSRYNYSQITIASVVNATTFTCTAGSFGTLPSLTLANRTSEGFVYVRSALGNARNGTSMRFENVTATNASFYVRSASGDAYPTGVLNGNHAVTVSSTASAQPINSPYTHSFIPTSEFRLHLQADRNQWSDCATDSTAAFSNRALRTQVVPDSSKQYKIRFRAETVKAPTVPIGRIVSISKSGTTTTTIVTDRPHGLTTTDYVLFYGVRNQTNFANQTTAVVVASVVNPTTFTVVHGTSATATSGGGIVGRQQGNISMASTGLSTIVVSSATSANGELSLVGNGNWAGLVIGDYVNVEGLYTEAGVSVGSNGSYVVENIATTTLTLKPIGDTVLSTFGTTNCGGAVIKRTDLRISFVRVFDYLRERVEITHRPSGDAQAAVPVYVTSGVSSTISGTPTVNLNTSFLVADVASAAITTSATTSAITPSAGAVSQSFAISVTARSGTNPTMDVVVQESDDSGTNWFDIWHFPRFTDVGVYRTPPIRVTGNRLRYVQTIAGTTPSFTRVVNRLQHNHDGKFIRQYFNRTIAPNTLNSDTGSFYISHCEKLNVIISMLAATTAPVFDLEVSSDNVNWISIADMASVANSSVYFTFTNLQNQYVRVAVKTAGTGSTLNYISINASE